MKYIKKYEAKHLPKFDVGDVVKISGKTDNTFYIIDGYDFRRDSMIRDICRLRKYSDKDKFADREGFFIWLPDSELELVPDQEIVNNKFNI